MATVVDITKYVIGRARVGFRAVGTTGPYTIIPTIGDTVIRMNAGAELFDPSVDLDLGGPIQGFQYEPKVGGIEISCNIAQLDSTNLGLLMPGSSSATATTGVVGGGLTTTLASAAAVGDTSVTVASGTGAAVGDFIKIDTSGNIEYRQLTAVAGTLLSFFTPLSIAHASGVAVVETDGDGRTTFSPPAAGRIQTSSFQEFIAEWPRPGAGWGTVKIFRGLPVLGNPYELTTGPRTMGRVPVTITGYRDPSNVDAAPFALIQ